MAVSNIEEVIEDIKNGKMVILVDDEDRENEGDLCMAAEAVTPEAINFMAKFGRGLICLTLDRQLVKKLQLPMMVKDNKSPYGTGFTVSIEARTGVTTGISAADRARTIEAAVAPGAKPEDLVSPGHIFPLRARRGGVLERTGQTEGSVDLARLAGMLPTGVICEIMKDDGTMARMTAPWRVCLILRNLPKSMI
jgi:3,4-dihydroxy 2-butanone 4-phosphate synthase/GTP cyclohydrolase II